MPQKKVYATPPSVQRTNAGGWASRMTVKWNRMTMMEAQMAGDAKHVANIYWRFDKKRKGYLTERLARTPSNVILAVSRRLAGEINKLTKKMQLQVVTYAEIIPAKEVLSRLEIIAEPLEPVQHSNLDAVPVPKDDGEQGSLF